MIEILLLSAAGLSFLVAIAAFSMVAMLNSRIKQQRQQIREEIEQLQTEIKALLNGAVGIGERVVDIEKRFGKIDVQQSQMQMVNTSNSNYANAAKLINMGATIDEVAKSCGLTRAEAELVAVMQSGGK